MLKEGAASEGGVSHGRRCPFDIVWVRVLVSEEDFILLYRCGVLEGMGLR